MSLYNWFLPHKGTHKKAHLISVNAILIYILIFILLQVSFSLISYSKPGLLGISSDIDAQKIIELTNKERTKIGLSEVSENHALDEAAKLKASNMFSENYWAHFAPSGKTPWDFILGSGYKFTFAGENLAKNYYKAEDIVSAWMNSPTHRDNLLNSKYDDIGIAVLEGILNGQKTVIIVQMFGTTKNISRSPVVSVSGKQIDIPKNEYISKPAMVASVQTQTSDLPKPVLDPYQFSKIASATLIFIIIFMLLLDAFVLFRRGVFRFSSHHVAHMALLSVAAASILTGGPGSIL